MKRGEVHWVIFGHPDKRRPAVVLTRNSAIGYLSTVTVAPITTTIRPTPSAVHLGPEDGLPEECSANLHNIQTVSQTAVGALIAVLTEMLIGSSKLPCDLPNTTPEGVVSALRGAPQWSYLGEEWSVPARPPEPAAPDWPTEVDLHGSDGAPQRGIQDGAAVNTLI